MGDVQINRDFVRID